MTSAQETANDTQSEIVPGASYGATQLTTIQETDEDTVSHTHDMETQINDPEQPGDENNNDYKHMWVIELENGTPCDYDVTQLTIKREPSEHSSEISGGASSDPDNSEEDSYYRLAAEYSDV